MMTDCKKAHRKLDKDGFPMGHDWRRGIRQGFGGWKWCPVDVCVVCGVTLERSV